MHISYSAQELHAWLDKMVRDRTGGVMCVQKRGKRKSELIDSPKKKSILFFQQPQVGALVFDGKLQAYVPYDKEWLKAQTLTRLQRAAGSGGRPGGR